ncbi:uncharacterized protein LOC134689316 [Mytilus trossulus]|uniref:uncharacterized protein LOC134689316 n=1 Tax=Mytilus trossulus TaxID=6551 RepID=UPI003003C91D
MIQNQMWTTLKKRTMLLTPQNVLVFFKGQPAGVGEQSGSATIQDLLLQAQKGKVVDESGIPPRIPETEQMIETKRDQYKTTALKPKQSADTHTAIRSKQPSASASPSSQQTLRFNNEPTSPSHEIETEQMIETKRDKYKTTALKSKQSADTHIAMRSKQPSASASPSSQQILRFNNEPTSPSHVVISLQYTNGLTMVIHCCITLVFLGIFTLFMGVPFKIEQAVDHISSEENVIRTVFAMFVWLMSFLFVYTSGLTIESDILAPNVVNDIVEPNTPLGNSGIIASFSIGFLFGRLTTPVMMSDGTMMAAGQMMGMNMMNAVSNLMTGGTVPPVVPVAAATLAPTLPTPAQSI